MDERQLLERIDRYIAENEQAIWADLAALVAIDSVAGPAAPRAPYGAGVRRALDAALQRAGAMGFEVNDGDGQVGWAELPGERAGHIAVIAHLDVVPPGEGWDGDPFALRQRDGWLIGRGVMDDKGPAVLSLYAANFLKELGAPLRYGVRVLLGCSEETGMTDVDYYLARNPEPLFCFSPDADFPVCNGEKGVYEADLYSAKLSGALVAFSGGIASNVVPERAFCVVRADAARLAPAPHITLTPQADGLVRLDAAGIAGHAAMPENTRNAIGLLVDYLAQNGLCEGAEKDFIDLLRALHSATDGSGLGIGCQDERFGPLTCIGGVIEFKDGVLRQNLNIRYPLATTGEALSARLDGLAAQAGGRFTPGMDAKPFYIPAGSPPINALLGAYADATGGAAEPYTMGGGTYARHFKNAVSYGPGEDGLEYPAFAGGEHGPNEGAPKALLLRALRVYALALYRLQQLEL